MSQRWTQSDIDRYNRNFNKNGNFQENGNKRESNPQISGKGLFISEKRNKYHNNKTEMPGGRKVAKHYPKRGDKHKDWIAWNLLY